MRMSRCSESAWPVGWPASLPDGNGSVSRQEVADVVEQSMGGNQKKIATTVRVALGMAEGRAYHFHSAPHRTLNPKP